MWFFILEKLLSGFFNWNEQIYTLRFLYSWSPYCQGIRWIRIGIPGNSSNIRRGILRYSPGYFRNSDFCPLVTRGGDPAKWFWSLESASFNLPVLSFCDWKISKVLNLSIVLFIIAKWYQIINISKSRDINFNNNNDEKSVIYKNILRSN